LTADQAPSINATAFYGFWASAIQTISPLAAAKFTAAQTIYLRGDSTSYGCGGFTPEQFSVMPAEPFRGFTASCISSTKASPWSGLTADGASGISGNASYGFLSSAISAIPGSAAAGFSSAFIAGLRGTSSSYGCGGFTSAQFGNISAESFSGFAADCISQTNAATWSGITADRLANIKPDAFYGFWANAIGNIPSSAVSGFSIEQLAGLRTTSYSYGCGGFVSDQFTAMTTSLYGLSGQCVYQTRAEAWAGLTSLGASSMSTSGMSGFTTSSFSKIPPSAIAGFNSTHIAALSSGGQTSGCAGWTDDQLAALTPEGFKGLSTDCIYYSPSGSWAKTDEYQVASIPSESFYGFWASAFAKIPGSAAKGFSSSQIAQLRGDSSSYGAGSLTSDQVANIPDSAFDGFRYQSLRNSPPSAWTTLSASQLSYIKANQINGFRYEHIRSLQGFSAKGFTAEQFGVMQSECSGFSDIHITNITVAAFSNLTWVCFSDFKSACINAISVPQIKVVPALSFGGLQQYHLPYFTNETLLAISVPQLSELKSATVYGFLANQYYALIQHHGPTFVNVFTLAQMRSPMLITSDSVSQYYVSGQLTSTGEFPSSLANTTWLQLSSLNRPVGGLTASMIMAIDPVSVPGLRSTDINGLAPSVVSAFSAAHGRYLTPSVIGAMTPEQFNALYLNVTEAFGDITWSGVSVAVVQSLTKERIAKMDYTAFSRMSCPAIAAFSPTQVGWMAIGARNTGYTAVCIGFYATIPQITDARCLFFFFFLRSVWKSAARQKHLAPWPLLKHLASCPLLKRLASCPLLKHLASCPLLKRLAPCPLLMCILLTAISLLLMDLVLESLWEPSSAPLRELQLLAARCIMRLFSENELHM
jgi:hypothetical protein